MIKGLLYPVSRARLNKSSEGGKLYQIYIEKDAQFKPSQYNNFFDSLYSIYSEQDPYQWFSFEFHGTKGGIALYSWLSGGISKEFIQSNINSIHQAAEVTAIEDIGKKGVPDYADFKRIKYQAAKCAVLELDSHYLFNTIQSDGERVGADMMASLCASMQNLDDNEEVAVQFLIRPVHFRSFEGRRP